MTEKKIVLAIDDSVQQLSEFKNILSAKYDLRVVKSAFEAISFLNRETTDIILLDIMMPNISGFEFLDDILNIPSYENVPVIIVSGNTSAEFLEKAKNSGARGVLIKPVKPELLIEEIEKNLA